MQTNFHAFHHCFTYGSNTKHDNMLKLFLLVCFSLNVLVGSVPLDKTRIEGRILGGNDTDISKFPHHVSVYLAQNEVFLGAGTIVSPTHVLTAASSTYWLRKLQLFIRAGSSSFEEGGVMINVTKIHHHPKYDDDTNDYGVSILELEKPLKFNDKTIKPIKLATKEPSAGTPASICGWGWINEFTDEADTLQSVTIPIIDRTKCASQYKPHDFTITPRMLCAGGNGKNVLFGDQGGALVVNGEVVGISELLLGLYGEGGRGRLPGGFVNIADPEINKFIKSIVKL